MAEAVRWGKRGARINAISPGIIMTPRAKDELTGSDFLMDGGVTAAYWYGELAP
jgi:NAD(P)-dependent dehydrogenase (short-subunit alcohol dehydrogenase family)